MKKILIASMAMVIMAGTFCFSVPQYISFQGVLKDSAGTPINGTRDIEFRICDAPTGGNVKWSEVQTVSVEAGLYSVQLGSANPLTFSTVFDGTTRYLGIKVLVGGVGDELLPRTMILTVPYAYQADTAATAAHATYADSAGSSGAAGAVLLGPTTIQSTSAANAIWVRSTTSGKAAISIESEGQGIYIGKAGQHAINIERSADTGVRVALAGGSAVYGESPTSLGGEFISTTNYGISGSSSDNIGVYGYSGSDTGKAGVKGENYSTNGIGVYGKGATAGGSFESTSGYAVWGNSPSNIGVYGYSSNTGIGVYGYSSNGQGIRGGSAFSHSGYFSGGLGIKVEGTMEATKDLILSTKQTPPSGATSGKDGMIRWNDSYIFVYSATAGRWKRATLEAF